MKTRIISVLILLSVILSACSKPAAPTEVPATEPPVVLPTEALSEVQGDIVTSIEEAKSATIQIEAQGSFVDPEFGQLLNSAGRGSGFIIHPSGIAVTNNHVVTGSALIKV
ncbi:MAG: peptidase S1, partial [Chloroflexi bacterium]|nr:peptidase S1 [Chloroflexota bacterium]